MGKSRDLLALHAKVFNAMILALLGFGAAAFEAPTTVIYWSTLVLATTLVALWLSHLVVFSIKAAVAGKLNDNSANVVGEQSIRNDRREALKQFAKALGFAATASALPPTVWAQSDPYQGCINNCQAANQQCYANCPSEDTRCQNSCTTYWNNCIKGCCTSYPSACQN